MSYTIVGSHCDGAYSIEDKTQPQDEYGRYPRKQWETKPEAIQAAKELQAESDRKGYSECYTVFAERCREVHRTTSHPTTLYQVRFYVDEQDYNGETMRVPGSRDFKEFTDLDEARDAANAYPRWRIIRTYDYRTVESQG